MFKTEILSLVGLVSFGLLLFSVSSILTPVLLCLLVWFFLYPLRHTPWATRLLVSSTFLLLLFVFNEAWPVLAPFVAGAVVAYLLDPFVDKLERVRIPRLIAAILLVLFLLTLISTIGLLLLPTVAGQIEEIVSQLPTAAVKVSDAMESLEKKLVDLGLPAESVDIRQKILGADTLFERIAQGALDITKAASSALGRIINIFLVFVVSFYLLIEMNRFTIWASTLPPRSHRMRVSRAFGEIDRIVGSWFRGQLVVAFTVGVLTASGLILLSTPYAVLIGLFAGILNIIPTVGLIASLILSFLLAPIVPHPLNYMIKVGVVFAVVQTLDSLVISPQIMSSRLNLHPAIIILAVVVSAYLLGPVGVLIAVPAASLIQLAGSWALSLYKNSEFYDAQDNTVSKKKKEGI